MTISIIVPAHNEEKFIGKCLKSIIDNAPDNLKEIIVVDNASTDRTREIAKKFKDVRVFSELRKGTSFARQRGYEQAKGDLLAFIDADTRVNKKWFVTVENKFRKDPGLVGLSGSCEFYDLPAWKNMFVRWYWRFLAEPASRITGSVVVGGNFVVKRSALKSIDGFDTSITFYGDDTNVGRRLKCKGKVHFHSKLSVHTSARRFAQEGFIRTGTRYIANFLSETIIHKPVTRKSVDVR
ncbi:MAG: glycosyltransferase family A protein [Candidatus Peregrinibacteria bacterium]